MLALAHPLMPFVTEEIYSYLSERSAEALVVHPFPESDEALIDVEAEEEIGEAIALTRALRRWRQLAEVPVKQVLTARAEDVRRTSSSSRLAKVEFSDDGGEPMASVDGVELLETEGVDPKAVAARIDERREKLRAEVKRGEGKLSNDGFVDQGPGRRGRRRAGEARRLPGGARGRGWAPTIARSDEIAAPGRRRSSAGSWAGADAAAVHAARHAAEPIRVDPRGRHQRQDLGHADDRRTARGARRLDRRLPVARTSTPGGSG